MDVMTVSPEPAADGAPWLRMERHRRELTGHCRRMLGSASEAEDAVQETMVRAWRGYHRFEGRATLRSWLHRIATNVCVDMMRMPQRRHRPMDLGAASERQAVDVPPLGAGGGVGVRRLPGHPGGHPVPFDEDPAERAATAEAVQEALVTALRCLPARQRAVLILREVLHWKAEEAAELLGTTVAAVNSALQRARATLTAAGNEAGGGPSVTARGGTDPLDASQRRLLAGYVDAFDRFDVESLVSLVHADATRSTTTDRPTAGRPLTVSAPCPGGAG